MATNFPSTLDTLTNPTATDTVDSPSHADQHADANDAIEALQTKVGVDGSAVTSSFDYKLSGVTGSDKAVSLAGAETLTNKTLTSPTVTSFSIDDDEFTIQDNGDNSKKAQFQVSGITTSTTRTYTLPDANTTLVGTDTTDTLTNKTIDANGTGNNISNLETDDFATNVVDTDTTLSANSDTRLASQKAVKSYVDASAGGIISLKDQLTTEEPMDGSTTPVAVMAGFDGNVIKSSASTADRAEFCGFVTEDVSSTGVQHVNSGEIAGSSGSVSVNAGNNRVLIVAFAFQDSPSEPTSVTWDGNSMTKIDTVDEGALMVSVWRYVAGDSGTNESGTLSQTGGSGATSEHLYYGVFENVDQTTPIQTTGTAQHSTSQTNINVSVTPTSSYAYAFASAVSLASITLDSRLTTRNTDSTPQSAAGDGVIYDKGTAETVSITTGTSSRGAALVTILNSVSTSNATTAVGGIVDTFSGLTPGIDYYLSDTDGEISSSAGSNSVVIGKSLTSSKLLIKQP